MGFTNLFYHKEFFYVFLNNIIMLDHVFNKNSCCCSIIGTWARCSSSIYWWRIWPLSCWSCGSMTDLVLYYSKSLLVCFSVLSLLVCVQYVIFFSVPIFVFFFFFFLDSVVFNFDIMHFYPFHLEVFCDLKSSMEEFSFSSTWCCNTLIFHLSVIFHKCISDLKNASFFCGSVLTVGRFMVSLQILKHARRLGDFLLVGIHDDDTVRYFLYQYLLSG